MIKTAYLRVYQPLSAFSSEERDRWLSEPEREELPDSRIARHWLATGAMLQADGLGVTDGAFVRRTGGDLMVCPWRTRLRMLAGLLAFRTSIPEEVADAFVPEEEARRAAHELAELGEAHPEVRSHILHANWHVPLRWFAAFDDSERILTEDRAGLRVRYETTLSSGRARLERALQVLEQAWIDAGVVDSVRELLGWLNEFSEEGVLELDYSSVAAMFADEELLEDHSASEVSACIEALASGDVERAGRTFATLSERWTEVRAHEVVN
ncbi:MAG: hypothetical protein M3290_09250 [Actinomycetota bacterium]|nr:hypothetical protein [Actinomycetota bacterium]